ncbi:MAG: molybdopterin-dependent oxidoreductase, partial [Actinomycetota bacterium]
MAVSTEPGSGISARSGRAHFWRGVLGMGAALLVVFTARNLFPLVSFPPARVADLFVRLTPGDLATFMIERLGKGAIRSLGIGVTVVTLLAGGALGVLIGQAQSTSGRAKRALMAALGVFLGSMLLALGTLGAGSLTAALVYGVASIIFAKIAAEVPLLAAVEPKRVEGDETPLDAVMRSRRGFIMRMGLLIAGLVAGGGILRVLRSRNPKVAIAPAARVFDPPPPDPGFPAVPGLAREITRNEDFYNVDINIVKPTVDHTGWRLKIHGLVGAPYELTFEQVQKDFEVVEMAHTLTCISNEVGGHLISTAVWRGVRLKDVLERAKLGEGTVDIVFRAAEGYSDSIPMDKALEETTLLVFGMNGEALPR